MHDNLNRRTGIDLLKIIAMFLIVISHVSQTFGTSHSYAGIQDDYFFDSGYATENIQYLVITIFRYFGSLGNAIFFICSAWFLCDSKRANVKKILHMLLDVWIISVTFMIIFSVSGRGGLTGMGILKSIFPNTLSVNWYITCYLIFYLLHPFLNWIIERMSQKQLLIFNIVSLLLYSGVCGIVYDKLLFSSQLVVFIVIYFAVAYTKKYMIRIISEEKTNLLICVGGGLGYNRAGGNKQYIGIKN